jgi:hypothetical protein
MSPTIPEILSIIKKVTIPDRIMAHLTTRDTWVNGFPLGLVLFPNLSQLIVTYDDVKVEDSEYPRIFTAMVRETKRIYADLSSGYELPKFKLVVNKRLDVRSRR